MEAEHDGHGDVDAGDDADGDVGDDDSDGDDEDDEDEDDDARGLENNTLNMMKVTTVLAMNQKRCDEYGRVRCSNSAPTIAHAANSQFG